MMPGNKILIISLILLLFLVGSVSAVGLRDMYPVGGDSKIDHFANTGTFSVNDAANNNVIHTVIMYLSPGQSADLVYHFASGKTIQGHADYTTTFVNERLYISLGTQSYTFDNLGIFQQSKIIHTSFFEDNGTFSLGLYQQNFITSGAYEPILLYPLSDTPSLDPVIQVDFLTPGLINDVAIFYATPEQLAGGEQDVQDASNRTANIITWITTFIGQIWSGVLFAWSIFSFFFIENLFLTVLLIEGAIFAYRVSTKSNIFTALSAIASDNIRLFEFTLGAVQKIISVGWDVVNLLNPLRWILGK